MGGNPIAFDPSFGLGILASLLFPILFALLVVYFMVSAIRFFKHKIATDKVLLQKLDELIKLQQKP
ncbi:MAG: hypothetical protein P4L69_21515 [Desulfosporosinus sp.]|nr:hypothetical protein [Desulfosporosinus sp.]